MWAFDGNGTRAGAYGSVAWNWRPENGCAGVAAAVSGAFSRSPAADARQRTLQAGRLSETLRRHQPQPSGEAGAHLRGDVERWFGDYLRRLAAERSSAPCPQILGVDEHFFTRRLGYATTFCDLQNHKVYDVVAGRSEASLEAWLRKPEGRHPGGARHRGLVSLMRRHRHNLTPDQQARLSHYLAERPALEQVYRFKQKLCYLLLQKHHTAKECRQLAPRLLRMIAELKQVGFVQLAQLGQTLDTWKEEIATMWRFTRNNGITEGFHTKMEVLQRQAYGFRNFNNYRLRVKVLCS